MNGVTWALLDVYARTLEGQAVAGLHQALTRHAPHTRLQGVGLALAESGGLLFPRGSLTPAGLTTARNAVARLRLGDPDRS